MDDRGHFFIADGGADKIRVCHGDGMCASFGDRRGEAPGEFSRPTDLALTDDGKLFVADRDNHRIQVFQVIFGNSDFHINPGLSDAWYDPATSGQGVLISVLPDIKQIFLAWFTYDTERPPDDVISYLREPGHRWMTAQGPYDVNTASLTVYLTEGGVFDEAVPVPTTDQEGIGSMTITFSDCNSGLMTNNIISPELSGEIPLQRVATDSVAVCETMEDL